MHLIHGPAYDFQGIQDTMSQHTFKLKGKF